MTNRYIVLNQSEYDATYPWAVIDLDSGFKHGRRVKGRYMVKKTAMNRARELNKKENGK